MAFLYFLWGGVGGGIMGFKIDFTYETLHTYAIYATSIPLRNVIKYYTYMDIVYTVLDEMKNKWLL